MDVWKCSLLTTPKNQPPHRKDWMLPIWAHHFFLTNPICSPSVHLQHKHLGKCPQILFPLEHVCCCACLWWHASHLAFLFTFWKCQACLSLETLHLLFSSSGMILHQFSAWIGHRATGHSSSVTSLWRPSDTLSMGSPPIHRCVTSQRVDFLLSPCSHHSVGLQDNLLSQENVSTKILGLCVFALVLAPLFNRKLSMKPVEEHWWAWWKIDDSVMDGSNYTPKQKSLKATGGWKQSSTDIQIGVLKFKYHLPFFLP